MSSKKSRKRQKEGAEGTPSSLSAAASRSGTSTPFSQPDLAAPGMLVVTNFLEKGESAGGRAAAGPRQALGARGERGVRRWA